jgi:hypothetical protein
MPSPVFSALLVRLPAAGPGLGLVAGTKRLQVAGLSFELEPLFAVPAFESDGIGLMAPNGWVWHVARPSGRLDGANSWEIAHGALGAITALAPGAPILIEPDLIQEWPYENPLNRTALGLGATPPICSFNDQVSKLPQVSGRFAWHLDDTFSQLRVARSSAAGASKIRIAHLDTGYDPDHATFPTNVNKNLQRNFVAGEPPKDAHDPAVRGVLDNPGHGTGTLSILAGKRFAYTQNGYSFDEALGGAPDAEIIPVRVGKSVVQLLTSSIAQGIHYVAELSANQGTPIHILSMSMGGVASAAWADAVNLAYESGVVLVTAAGNNFSAGFFGFPTRFIVYPARFRRVIAACGIMADCRPYYDLPFGTMQGNWGPESKMATAIAAFTPNTAWAELGCAALVDMDGAGTSAATPQVAAGAALYLQKYGADLFDDTRYPDPWMRVEAVRQALFSSADKSPDGGNSQKLGNGVLQAARALDVAPPARVTLQKTPPDSAIFPFLTVLAGTGVADSTQADRMLALEATQLAQRWTSKETPNPLEEAIPDPDVPLKSVATAQTRKFLEALIQHPDVSKQLKQRADQVRTALFRKSSMATAAPLPSLQAVPTKVPGPLPPARVMPFLPPDPPCRSLRAFSIDPALSTQLETAPISEMTFRVPWERVAPGPVGEYLEVIDVDPASGCFYAPINLDDPKLLAQDGFQPSEGTPQFHQQMVYAVASLTIQNFEHALGRRVLWRPGPSPDPSNPKNDSLFVPRLRVYPHALREQNAYYSPQKIALLFGYFSANDSEPGDHIPGGTVFTCLSHDIVAHETTHALLDGMHRRFLNATNPDVLAFHEAFADIVALFQHFTFPEILVHQIASTQGNIRSHQTLLSQLAGEFGRATGLRGALRYAIGKVNKQGKWEPHPPNPMEYQQTREPHARGAILVAAVFDAFVSIYERRTADLLRVATNGTGILRPGAIHPDLVNRLSKEAAKAAKHVLTMCIRALDYCPPVDITFGEYLRAILTADFDLVGDDQLHYRIAFIEAFRRRGIYPLDVRTLSVESLLWRRQEQDELQPSHKLESGLELLRNYVQQYIFASSDQATITRERLFQLQREMRRDLHTRLKDLFASGPEGLQDASFLGLDANAKFEAHTARFALRTNPFGGVDPQLLVVLLQETLVPIDPDYPKGPKMPFESGCSIVADLRQRKIRYCIRKKPSSAPRLARQQQFALGSLDSLRATYFQSSELEAGSEPFASLHRGMR